MSASATAERGRAHLPSERHRLEQGLAGLSPSSPWDQLANFPITPLSLLSDDAIVVPEDWVAAGSSRQLSARTIRILDYLPKDETRAQCAYHEKQIRRIIFALLMIPRQTNTGVRRLAPKTWIGRSQLLLRAARWAIEHRFAPESLFRHLSLADLAEIALAVGVKATGDLNRDLIHYGARGLLIDVPNPPVQPRAPGERERSYKAGVPKSAAPKPVIQTQPFPDTFVTELLRRCLFLSRDVGTAIMDAYEQLADTSGWGVHTQGAILKRRLAALARLDWQVSDGSRLDSLPFSIALRSAGAKTRNVSHWPPQSWTELKGLFTYLQCANFNIIAFCTGARWSEHSGASLDCVSESDDATFRSRTFKLTNMVGGKLREWPLADEALAALRQQQRYARIVGGPTAKNLWVLLQPKAGGRMRGDAQNIMNETNTHFVRALGLDILLDGRPATHRWRATVARLGAMALIEAPRVLMELFGHRNMEMTLRYILSNPDIRAELDEAYGAAAYAMTRDLMEGASGLGGPAAPRLRSMLDEVAIASPGASPFIANNDDILDLLNLSGPAARIVRPGITCIKQAGQYGPCSKGIGAPNPARCKVACEHRLEDAQGARHADALISFLIARLASEDLASQPLLRANLEGQLLTQLRRFSDVRARWLKANSTALAIWSVAKAPGAHS